MKNIIIGFSRSSSRFPIFSWLIMLAQRNNFSHTYIRFNVDSVNKEVVFQAKGLTVNFMGFELFKQEEIVVKEFELEISDTTYNNLIGSAIDLLGEPYSMLQILNSTIYLLFKKAPFDSQIKGWDCSKLVAYELQEELGFKIPEDLDVITPKDLYQFLESIYGKN
jgi:hypothetical protein